MSKGLIYRSVEFKIFKTLAVIHKLINQLVRLAWSKKSEKIHFRLQFFSAAAHEALSYSHVKIIEIFLL